MTVMQSTTKLENQENAPKNDNQDEIEEELTQVAAWSFASYWEESVLVEATNKKKPAASKSLKIERKKYGIENL